MPETVDPHGQRRRQVGPIVLLLLLAALVGMGFAAWLFHRFDVVSDFIKPRPAPIVRSVAPRPAPPAPPLPTASETEDDALVVERVGKIEEQVAQLDERAAAASDEARRAEALLLTFAARRAIERGAALGYIEGLLRERFGGVEPQAVATVISASRRPVTIEQLREQLHALEPQLSVGSEDGGWWDGVRRELAGLIIVRRAFTPSAAPVDRLARAQDDLTAGRVDAALLEISRLPARNAAQSWLLNARRYVQARIALDRLETAALLKPTGEASPTKQ